MAFEPDMKLTAEFVDIMGGRIDAPQFKNFMKQCVYAYLAVRLVARNAKACARSGNFFEF